MFENNGWMMEEFARTRREEWLHDAELYRLERMALALRPQRTSLFTRILYRVGRQMAAWGTHLEERYRCAGELNTATAGNYR